MKMKEFLSADMQEKQTKKCPYCAEGINIEAIKCKHCHSDLSKIIPKRKEYMLTKEDAVKEIPSLYNRRDRKNSDEKKAQTNAINIFKIFIYMFIAFIAIALWYISIPALFIWLIWKKTKLTEKNKFILSIIILLFFIILKISSDYNHRAPTITITEPENNISVQSDSIIIKGTIDPKNSQLQIDGNKISIKDGYFKYETQLIEENSFIVLVADNSGKKTENLLIINRILSDDERAIVNLENIKNNDVVKLPQFEIKGSTLLESVTVKINNQDVEIKDNQFSYIIDLKEGKNDINIIATNTKSFIIKKETIVVNRELTEKEIAVIEEERKVRVEKERIAREEARRKKVLFPVKELINKTPLEIESLIGDKMIDTSKNTTETLMTAFIDLQGLSIETSYTLIKHPKVKYNGTTFFDIWFDNPLNENDAWEIVGLSKPNKAQAYSHSINNRIFIWRNIPPFFEVQASRPPVGNTLIDEDKIESIKVYLLTEDEYMKLY